MRIETGTTNERLARCGIMTLALGVFAVWFTIDGWYAYPRKALEASQAFLKLKQAPEPHPKLAYNYPKEVEAKFKKGMNKADVLTELGKPLLIESPDPNSKVEHWHYIGQYGRLDLGVRRTTDPNAGTVVTVNWEETPADYRHESVRQQKIFAVVCSVLVLAGLIWSIKIWRTRVVVDETGLTHNRLVVPWDAMTALDSKDYHAKGWLALVYASGGSERSLRLDSFKVDAFDDVVDAICQRKGFVNPIPIDDLDEEEQGAPDDEGSAQDHEAT